MNLVNDVVKMDWNAEHCMFRNKTKKKPNGTMCFLGNVYPTVNGDVCVFFDGSSAYVFEDEQGLWGISDMKDLIKRDGLDAEYPHCYEEYTPLVNAGMDDNVEFNDALFERLRLTEFKDDIVKRLEDASPYSAEMEYKP